MTVPVSLIPKEYLLKQTDIRWAHDHLGASDSTLAGYGCAVTCLAMLFNMLSDFVTLYTPAVVNETMKSASAFRGTNLVDWPRIPEVFPAAGLRYSGRIDCPDRPAPMDRIDGMLNQNMPVVVYVDASRMAGLQQHFILIHGKLADGNYRIADPYFSGDLLLPRYGGTAAKAIYGIILYERDTRPAS